MLLYSGTYYILARFAHDELKELKKKIEKINTMVEHLEASLAKKEVQENQLADANIALSYDLVQAKLHASYLEQTLGLCRNSTDAQQADVSRLQGERDGLARELDRLKLQSKLA